MATPSDRYLIMLRGIRDEGPEFWWDATYLRSVSYAPNTGWVDGDREQYRCAYGFLQSNGVNVGRVSFFTVPDAGPYTLVNDKFMEEAQRYYDGRPADPNLVELHDCQDHFGGAEYEPYFGPTQLPTVVYVLDGKPIEFRNYKTLVTGPNVTFKVAERTPQKVTVVAYIDGLPAVAVYYESIVPNLVMESDIGPQTEVPIVPVPLTSGSALKLKVYTSDPVDVEGGLVTLAVGCIATGPVATPTVSGLGTWSLVAASGKLGTSADTRRLFLYQTQAAPGSGAVQLTFTNTLHVAAWSLTEWGTSSIVRNWRQLQAGFVTSGSLPLPGADPANPLYCVSYVGQDIDVIPGAGWSELAEVRRVATLEGMWRDTPAATADISWGQSGHHLMIAAELDG